jgi:hypothetical protein
MPDLRLGDELYFHPNYIGMICVFGTLMLSVLLASSLLASSLLASRTPSAAALPDALIQ